MKRIIALSLAVLMIAALFVACGGKKDDSKSDSASSADTAKSVDPAALLDKINEQYGINDSSVQGLKKLSTTDELDRYYKIAADDVKQFAAERSSSSEEFMEIVIVEANDSAADRIATQLNSRLDSQRNTAKSYSPESAEMLDGSQVKTTGNFVYLVINEKQDEINKMIEDAVK